MLATIEKIEAEGLDWLAAQTTAQRGDVALTRLRYLDAAQRFSEAAAKVPQGHETNAGNTSAQKLMLSTGKAMNSATMRWICACCPASTSCAIRFRRSDVSSTPIPFRSDGIGQRRQQAQRTRRSRP